MTYEFWVTAALLIVALLFLTSDVPVKRSSNHRMKSKRRA
jgi:hypothetical protein